LSDGENVLLSGSCQSAASLSPTIDIAGLKESVGAWSRVARRLVYNLQWLLTEIHEMNISASMLISCLFFYRDVCLCKAYSSLFNG